MAVTDEAIGADQVWRGLEGLTGYNGRGIGIALIDSGVARLPAIRGRIVADVDFTAGATARRGGRSSATARTSPGSSRRGRRTTRRSRTATAAWRRARTSST